MYKQEILHKRDMHPLPFALPDYYLPFHWCEHLKTKLGKLLIGRKIRVGSLEVSHHKPMPLLNVARGSRTVMSIAGQHSIFWFMVNFNQDKSF